MTDFYNLTNVLHFLYLIELINLIYERLVLSLNMPTLLSVV